ncbi:uncharacterized protein N7483_003241 [Penicillium malachiteum]|uniref:uncharacterized protein n=1 Tax=Penicillium malachiteum TaxID=1324776 RepID=UPI002548F0D8|nr:uncharacterized protein N7483_003241 [Penicillium malachiteum]KAJ5728733.1 hypothetical protein N7483_003241 [Penicillium malachiteum]
MTDTSSLAITHATTDPYPAPPPLGSPVNGAISDSGAPDEEEPYTIKCICQFDEDDGSTVFCERCETWQHIVCYYPDKRVPDVHNCVDCEPRLLDNRRAADRQRQRRIREQSEETGDRRKRSSAKATRKKPKEGGDVNGLGHQRTHLLGPPNIPMESRKRRSSTSVATSPTKSAGPFIPLYSNEFLQLYDRDDEHKDMDSNLFVNVNLVGESASWVKNPDALAQVTNGRRTAADTFIWSDAALDRSYWPSLQTETITDSDIEINGRNPTWKIVKTQDAVQKDAIIGELTGKVGIFDDYCLDSNNRWSELRHPEPFVFFNSQLPLYIDSRHEGSMLRYTRRSCRPNVTMKIFITNDVEYHFCFVAKESIPAGSEITIMWYLDAQVLSGSSNGVVQQESSDNANDAASVCISNTLANFGGCACENPQTCLLAIIDRRRHPRLADTITKQANGKRKKVKTSKTGTSQDTTRASTSRAGSETTKHPDDDDVPGDSRSTSGSVRGQPLSRDMSPTVSNPGTTGLELSTRERRKIADAEKQFQQLENDQKTTKKKKRTSGPSVTSAQSPAAVASSSSTQAGGSYFGSQRGSTKTLRIDTAASQSHSPTSALSPGSFPTGPQATSRKTSGSNTPFTRSPMPRRTYVDMAVQVDMDAEEEAAEEARRAAFPRPRIDYVPLPIRLLRRYADDRRRAEDAARQQLSSAGSDSIAPFDFSSPLTQSPITAWRDKQDATMVDAHSPRSISFAPNVAGDVEMREVPESSSVAALNDTNQDRDRDMSKPLMAPPWPSTLAHNTRLPGTPTPFGCANLRVDMPPPGNPIIPPSAISPGSASTASLTSPSNVDASSHSIQMGGAPTPTPAKKKLSLGDYLSRRGTLTTPTTEKSQAQATNSSSSQQTSITPGLGLAASIGETMTPTKTEPLEPHDVAMKDASDSNQPHVPSISS